jgi:hypothetical protein
LSRRGARKRGPTVAEAPRCRAALHHRPGPPVLDCSFAAGLVTDFSETYLCAAVGSASTPVQADLGGRPIARPGFSVRFERQTQGPVGNDPSKRMRPLRRHRSQRARANNQLIGSDARSMVPHDEIGSDGGLSRTVARLATLDRDGRAFGSAVRSLLQRVRVVSPLPRGIRDRALARARAALTALPVSMAGPPGALGILNSSPRPRMRARKAAKRVQSSAGSSRLSGGRRSSDP